MRISIVTVCHNSSDALPDFLASLQPYVCGGGDHEVDVVAVDNASQDGSVDLLRAAPFAVDVVRSATNDGYAAGINRGVRRRPNADAYLILNPDTRLHPGSVEALVEGLASPGAGIAVPRMVRDDGGLRYTLRRAPSARRAWAELLMTAERAATVGDLGERVGAREAYGSPHAVDWASGSAMLISAACLRVVGPWDESFFLYSEETDFCLRSRERGLLTYYCPDALVTHLGGASRTSPQLHATLTLNRIRCFRKHNPSWSVPLFASAVWLKQLLRALRGDRAARAALQAFVRPSTRHPDLLRMRNLARKRATSSR